MADRRFRFHVGRGATGFRHRRDGALTGVDQRLLRQACWAAATRIRGTADQARWVSPATYSCTALRGRDGRSVAVVVAHLHLPFVLPAEVAPCSAGVPGALSPEPEWAEVFTGFGFTVLDDATLRIPLAEVDLSALARVEREQVRVWRPATLGELLFNSWD